MKTLITLVALLLWQGNAYGKHVVGETQKVTLINALIFYCPNESQARYLRGISVNRGTKAFFFALKNDRSCNYIKQQMLYEQYLICQNPFALGCIFRGGDARGRDYYGTVPVIGTE